MVSFSRIYAYFKRGWSLIAVPIGATNFLLISYRLLVQQVSVLHRLFPSLTMYVLVTVPLGFVFAVALGWWDYKYGTAPQETERIARYSAWHRSLMRSIYYLADGDSERAKEEVRKWV